MKIEYTRPEIRIAEIMPDGALETTGQYPFVQFETVPNNGDILVRHPYWGGEPEGVVVVDRAYLHPDRRLGRWWIITRPIDDKLWRALWDLDQDVDRALDGD